MKLFLLDGQDYAESEESGTDYQRFALNTVHEKNIKMYII